MSGTSLDGLDIAYCKFSKTIKWAFEIINSRTVTYSQEFKNRLRVATELSESKIQDLSIEFGLLMAEEVKLFIKENQIQQIDLIASHGHTIFHQPEEGVTLQIGDVVPLFNEVNKPVVYDFRTQDVLLGGQGAPLVPVVDKLLFTEYDACLNLGGFSNISFDVNNERIAFDICPVNIVLNHLSNKLGFDYDKGGEISSSANVDDELLKLLNSLPYYAKSYPKSLGREWVEEFMLPIVDNQKLAIECVMRTFVEHVSVQISEVINQYKLKKVLVTGGGAYNDFLIRCLQSYSPNRIERSSNILIESKEAMAFAFLGLLKMKNEINVYSSVTGSVKNHISGKLYKG